MRSKNVVWCTKKWTKRPTRGPLKNPRLESSDTCGGPPFFTAEAANASHLSHRVHRVFSQIRGATQVQLLLDPHLMRFNSLAAYSQFLCHFHNPSASANEGEDFQFPVSEQICVGFYLP